MPPAIVLGVTLAATAVAAYGQVQSAKATEQAAEHNAKLAESNAIKEELESREERRRTRAQGKKLKGRQRAAIAKSGVTEEGSPLLAMAENATNIELNIADQARSSGVRADNFRGQAEVSRFEGKSQATALRTQAGATLLSGASRGASQFQATR